MAEALLLAEGPDHSQASELMMSAKYAYGPTCSCSEP